MNTPVRLPNPGLSPAPMGEGFAVRIDERAARGCERAAGQRSPLAVRTPEQEVHTVDDETRAARVSTLRTYAADLSRTAQGYRAAAQAPGLPGGFSGRAGMFLRGEASRLEGEAQIVARQADEWEDDAVAAEWNAYEAEQDEAERQVASDELAQREVSL